MLRRPPRSTRTDTLFPYTTLFRSAGRRRRRRFRLGRVAREEGSGIQRARPEDRVDAVLAQRHRDILQVAAPEGDALQCQARETLAAGAGHRSEESRVGKECVSTCISRWSPGRTTKNKRKRNKKETV